MSWMIPSYKLDPEQRSFINQLTSNQKRNYWLKGFAGSGKSILLVHALIQAKLSNPKIKACVIVFTRSLVEMFQVSIPKELGIPVKTYRYFEKFPQRYDLILVDEVQDITASVLMLIKQNCTQLIVAGDSEQSIYQNAITPQNIQELIHPTVCELTILHRLSNKIIEIAKSIFPEKHLEQAKRSRFKNVDVTLAIAQKKEEEIRYVWENASQSASPGVPTAILLPQQRYIQEFVNQLLVLSGFPRWIPNQNDYGNLNFREMNEYLTKCGFNLQYLGNNYGSLSDSSTREVVYLMTYHSAKGLDFETVFLPMLNDRTQIWSSEALAKNLFFVALTRTRLNLFLTYTGEAHPYIKQIPKNLLSIKNLPLKNQEAKQIDDEFLF